MPPLVEACGDPVVKVPAPRVTVIALAVVLPPLTTTVKAPLAPTFVTVTSPTLTPPHAEAQAIDDPDAGAPALRAAK